MTETDNLPASEQVEQSLAQRIRAIPENLEEDDATWRALRAEMLRAAEDADGLESYAPYILSQYARMAFRMARMLDFDLAREDELVRELERAGFRRPPPRFTGR